MPEDEKKYNSRGKTNNEKVHKAFVQLGEIVALTIWYVYPTKILLIKWVLYVYQCLLKVLKYQERVMSFLKALTTKLSQFKEKCWSKHITHSLGILPHPLGNLFLWPNADLIGNNFLIKFLWNIFPGQFYHSHWRPHLTDQELGTNNNTATDIHLIKHQLR